MLATQKGRQGKASCRDQKEEAEGPAVEQDLTKLADDLVQKFEDQWKAAAENLEAASKAFDNLEGAALAVCCVACCT